jgi:hypothetical protein
VFAPILRANGDKPSILASPAYERETVYHFWAALLPDYVPPRGKVRIGVEELSHGGQFALLTGIASDWTYLTYANP